MAKLTVKTKRVFRKISTVTYFQILDISTEHKMTVHKKDGKPVTFNQRRTAENYCSKNNTAYMEVKNIFYL